MLCIPNAASCVCVDHIIATSTSYAYQCSLSMLLQVCIICTDLQVKITKLSSPHNETSFPKAHQRLGRGGAYVVRVGVYRHADEVKGLVRRVVVEPNLASRLSAVVPEEQQTISAKRVTHHPP